MDLSVWINWRSAGLTIDFRSWTFFYGTAPFFKKKIEWNKLTKILRLSRIGCKIKMEKIPIPSTKKTIFFFQKRKNL